MFSDMFAMLGNYESRCVGNYKNGTLRVSTALVTDCPYQYETAVEHPRYGDSMIVVQGYTTLEQAKLGHERWVADMTAPELPAELHDVGGCIFARLMRELNPDSARHEYQ